MAGGGPAGADATGDEAVLKRDDDDDDDDATPSDPPLRGIGSCNHRRTKEMINPVYSTDMSSLSGWFYISFIHVKTPHHRDDATLSDPPLHTISFVEPRRRIVHAANTNCPPTRWP